MSGNEKSKTSTKARDDGIAKMAAALLKYNMLGRWQYACGGNENQAKIILAELSNYLRTGTMPSEIRDLLAEALDHLRDREPLALFGKPKRGRSLAKGYELRHDCVQAVKATKRDHPDWSNERLFEEAVSFLESDPEIGRVPSAKTIARAWKQRDEYGDAT